MGEAAKKQNQEKIAISISNFLGGGVAQSDVYILLKSGKFIKIAKKGAEFNKDRLENYKDQNVENFYIDPEDYKEYLDKTVKVLEVIEKTNFDSDKKFAIVSGAAESVLTSMESFEIQKETLEHAQTVTRSMVTALGNIEKLNTAIAQIATLNSYFIKHSACVSALAISIARKLDWTGEATLNTIGLGALLHDVGKREFPEDLMFKRRIDMTHDEVKLYESHPLRGMEILASLNMPTQILSIVYEHHEVPGGRGFPRGLSRPQIFPLARLVSLADTVAHELIDPNDKPNANTLLEAANNAIEVHEHTYDRVFWEALFKLTN